MKILALFCTMWAGISAGLYFCYMVNGSSWEALAVIGSLFGAGMIAFMVTGDYLMNEV